MNGLAEPLGFLTGAPVALRMRRAKRRAPLSMQSIVVIEDDRAMAELVRIELSRNDFAVTVMRDGDAGLAQVRKTLPHLVITDINLPKLSGLEICKAIRRDERLRHLPILILSASGDEADCVVGLECGADDYVIKPFRKAELVARVRVLLRRFESASQPKPMPVQIGPFSLDPGSYAVRNKKEPLPMSTTEFRLLYFLAAHPNRIFTRDQLLDEVWGRDRSVTPRNVDNFVYNLRAKIEPDPERPLYLKTIRGAGYVFSAD